MNCSIVVSSHLREPYSWLRARATHQAAAGRAGASCRAGLPWGHGGAHTPLPRHRTPSPYSAATAAYTPRTLASRTVTRTPVHTS